MQIFTDFQLKEIYISEKIYAFKKISATQRVLVLKLSFEFWRNNNTFIQQQQQKKNAYLKNISHGKISYFDNKL